MDSILDILTIDRIDEDNFITRAINSGFPGLYGGQVAAQSLLAACKTVEPDQVPHSLHAYFLRAGRGSLPIELQVFRDRDGRQPDPHHHGSLLASGRLHRQYLPQGAQ